MASTWIADHLACAAQVLVAAHLVGVYRWRRIDGRKGHHGRPHCTGAEFGERPEAKRPVRGTALAGTEALAARRFLVNPYLAQLSSSLGSLGAGFLEFLPRLVVALVVLAVFLPVAALARAAMRRFAHRRQDNANARHYLALALSRMVQGAVVLIGVFVAVTAAFPSFTPGDLVSVLGLGGVAIGFAFKDIFQNYLAGILILLTRPFLVGDQIRFKDYEGEVEQIQTRATYLNTYDGRRVVIPNGELYTNAVTVNTAFARRRWQYDIGIGYGDDIEKARSVILAELVAAEDVLPDPKADVIVVALDASTVNLRARWWTASRMADGLNGQDRVLTRIKKALMANGIDLPFPTRQVLFHDQTESTDGDRRRQREGWPAGRGAVPGPRHRSDGEDRPR